MKNPSLSVIIPVFQNELNIQDCYNRVSSILTINKIDFELIFVNDGSTDNSYFHLIKIQKGDERVTVINLVRNFGQVAAILCGLDHSRGKCCVNISADLQDPPEMIVLMYETWRKDEKKLIIGARIKRNDSFISNLSSKIFYSLFQKYAIANMPKGGFDFFLVDREILNIVLESRESNTFLQGLLLWPGFNPHFIEYERQQRTKGKSQWHFSKKINYFIDGFVSYSFFPIRMISVFGIFFFILALLLVAILVFQRIYIGTQLPGWTSIVILILFLQSFQFIFIGVLGEYIWRNIEQNRKRPIFIVESIKKINQ